MIALLLLLGCSTEPVEPQADPFEAECPWSPGEGVEVGSVATDLTFDRCDAGTFSLHDQCGSAVTIVVYAFGWCRPCIDHIELAGEVSRLHSHLVGGVKHLPIRYKLRPA